MHSWLRESKGHYPISPKFEHEKERKKLKENKQQQNRWQRTPGNLRTATTEWGWKKISLKEWLLSIISWIFIHSDKTNSAQVIHLFGQWTIKGFGVYIAEHASHCLSVLFRILFQGWAINEMDWHFQIFPCACKPVLGNSVNTQWTQRTKTSWCNSSGEHSSTHCCLMCSWVPLNFEFTSPPDFDPELALE